MNDLYNKSAPKKPTNLSINSSLLAEVKSLKVNLSATLEKALEEALREAQKTRWLENNKKAIENCNKHADQYGLFADKFRKF